MLLSSPTYLLFLGTVFLLYYLLRGGAPRRLLLLGASYFFYFELSGFYIGILVLVTGITYYGARALRSEHRGATFFAVLILLVLIPLLFFKYFGPFVDLIGGFRPHPLPRSFMTLVMPIGISFFTFAALGYLIDVYLEVTEPETSLVRVALFLAFFPLVSAGPIERGGRFMSQFELKNKFSANVAWSGVQFILVGLVLKVIFAKYLGDPCQMILDAPQKWIPLENLIGMIDYSFFIYSDFAGYSLIAIGSARLLGLTIQPNFQQPFLSATTPEFWRRWHISLSSWVRDYLFTPLRTEWRRFPKWGMAGALLISITAIGVWHGAKAGYLIFGLMNASFVVASTFTLPRRNAFWNRLPVPPWLLHLQRVFVTFFLLMLTFVAFRANTLDNALTIYRSIFSFSLIENFVHAFQSFVLHRGPALPLPGLNYRPWFLITVLIIGDILVRKKVAFDKLPLPLQMVLYGLGIIEVMGGWLDTYVARPFVYNQF